MELRSLVRQEQEQEREVVQGPMSQGMDTGQILEHPLRAEEENVVQWPCPFSRAALSFCSGVTLVTSQGGCRDWPEKDTTGSVGG